MSDVLDCRRHPSYWLASCDDCRDARRATLLASVQSCTVHAPARAADQQVCEDPARVPVVLLGRTHP